MFELRRIQHGERPVTGQNHRDNIANFMAKHVQEPAGANGKENIPANVDAVEEHRPEAVVVEVIMHACHEELNMCSHRSNIAQDCS